MAVEPYLVVLEEGARPYTNFKHAGTEFIHILEGRIDYRHGDNVYALEPGDSLLFDSAAPHGPEALHELPAKLLSVIVYPRQV